QAYYVRLVETFPFEIGETAHALRKSFDRLAVGLGVTRVQWKVLFRLTRQPGMRQVDLADMLDIEPITLCRIIDRLQAAGLVKRTRKKADDKGTLRTILMLIVPALLLLTGAYYWLASGGSVATDDAQVKQDIVSVSPQVNGQVVQVLVRNGARVKGGDVLFRI